MIKNVIVLFVCCLCLVGCYASVVSTPSNGYATPKGIDAVPSN